VVNSGAYGKCEPAWQEVKMRQNAEQL